MSARPGRILDTIPVRSRPVRCRRSCSAFSPASFHRAQHHRRRARCRATLHRVRALGRSNTAADPCAYRLPLALPAIVSGLRVGTGLVVLGVVVTEMLASLGGIGFLISYHRALLRYGPYLLRHATRAPRRGGGERRAHSPRSPRRLLARTGGGLGAHRPIRSSESTRGAFTRSRRLRAELREAAHHQGTLRPGRPIQGGDPRPGRAVPQGLSPRDTGFLVHGTTVATNAVLEGAGVRAGLLITRGFRAVYEARGWVRPEPGELLDPFFRKPPLLIPQSRTEEISGRLDSTRER